MMREPATSNQIKRWIEEPQLIGFQQTGEEVTHQVLEGKVALEDGRIVSAWIILLLPTVTPHSGMVFKRTLLTKPRLDHTVPSSAEMEMVRWRYNFDPNDPYPKLNAYGSALDGLPRQKREKGDD